MKTRRFLWVLFVAVFFMVLCSLLSFAQPNQAEVPGDDFSLEGALELFKKSTSPEDFERQLNSADAKVNNLDLNGDGDIDYIKVIDRNEGNVHAFILQAIISERESQDVAVIELEKLDNGKAVLQITGDEDVYGMETIIEPTTEVKVNAGTSTARTVVNVWAWPSVQYVYSPYYLGWVSPYRWSMRPVWWHPWRPVAYYTYSPWWQPYRPYYSVCYTHRIGYAQQLYRPMRTTSVYVYNRHHDQIVHYRNNNTYYGQRNDRSTGRNSQHSGAYDRRNANPGSNGGRPSTQHGSPVQQSDTRNNQQPDWRNNHGTSPNQNDEVNATRTYSSDSYRSDRMNRSTDQGNGRGSISNQDQNIPQRSRTTDFQQMPERLNRASGTATHRESNVQRGQTMPTRNGNRQSPSINPGRTQQLSSPRGNDGVKRRGA